MPLPINYMPQVLARLQAEEEKKKAKEQKSSKNQPDDVQASAGWQSA